MLGKILNPVIGIVDKVIDKVLSSDGDKAAADKMKAEARLMMVDASLKEDKEFRSFMIQFEGAAKDLHPLMAAYRASLRPTVSYAAIICTLVLVMRGMEVPQVLAVLDYIVASFWFGERAFVNAGPIIEKLWGKK